MERREKEINEKEERRPSALGRLVGQVWGSFRKTVLEVARAVLAAGEKLTEDTAFPKALAALCLSIGIPLLALLAASAKFPPGVYPAGFALVCAVGGSGQHRFRGLGEHTIRLLDLGVTAGVFLGAALSCLWIGGRCF